MVRMRSISAGCGAPQSCTAIRRRRLSLVVSGGLPLAERVSGDALTVLCTVVTEVIWRGSYRDAVRQAATWR